MKNRNNKNDVQYKLAQMAFILFALMTGQQLQAQTPTFDWAFSLGGTYYDKGIDLATDSAGNVYTLGAIANTVDFDPGPNVFNLSSNTNNSTDNYIAKYNAAKGLLWAHVFGGTGDDTPIGLAVDASGNCYITGRFSGTVDFNPDSSVTSAITASGAFDVFIAKFSPSGNYLWAKNFGGTYGTFVDKIAIDGAGSVYTSGTFQTTTDFDPSPAVFNLVSTGGQDPYLAKLDSAGNFVWALNPVFSIYNIYIDIQNSLFLSGSFNDTTDFDFSPTQTLNVIPSGNFDIYIAKYDTAADLTWVKHIGSSGNSGPSAITTDIAGNIVVTGIFSGTMDFDPGANTFNLTASGSGSTLSDMFFLKLDAAANFVWAKKIGGNNFDLPTDVDTDNAGSIYITGQFKSPVVDFDPDTTVTFNLNGTMSSYDAFVLILSTAGNFIYAYEIGGQSNGDDYGNGISVNPSGSYFVTGTYYGPIDFNPGTGTTTLDDNGNTDAFIQKMNFVTSGILEEGAQPSFSIYPNPARQLVIISRSLAENQAADVKIFDAIGKEMLITRVTGGSSTIDVSKFEKGIYFIQLNDNIKNKKYSQVKKLIIND